MNIFDLFEGDSARDKWNKDSAKRDAAAKKREEEMTARHNRGKEDMSGAIDRLEKHLNTPVKEHDMSEGWQDFNKVEPYAVCLAGKPVKKFDYYEEARRFHDNWKQKLYREGNKEKADKITLMPLNLDEEEKKLGFGEFPPKQEITIVPPKKLKSGETYQDKNKYWQSQGQAPIYKTNEVKADPTGSWVVYGGSKVVKFKTHTGAKAYAEKAGGKVASSEFYADKIQKQGVAEADPNAPYTPSPAKPFRNPPGFNKQGTGVGNKLAQQTRAELAKKKQVNEFAPGNGDDGEEDTLLKFARLWWNGDEATQDKVEEVLAKMGWTIGENESGDENDACFVVRDGDMNGDSYIAFGPEDLNEGSMSTAAHHHAGPEFPGYWKGTDSASLSRKRMVGDDVEEGYHSNTISAMAQHAYEPKEGDAIWVRDRDGNKVYGQVVELRPGIVVFKADDGKRYRIPAGRVVKDLEEGIEGNMTVKSSPLSEPLRKRNFVAKNSPITGAGKHTNQLKKAMAAGRNAKHKAQTIPFDEGMNFMEWAVKNDYNFAKHPAVYKEAKEAFKKKINEISKDKVEKYYTDVVKKQADKIGIQPNMYDKLEPKHQRGIDRATNRLYKNNEERGPIAPHETYYGAMDEAKGLGTQVKIIKGHDAGKIGWVREIKLGAYKGAPKTYYIDLEDGGQANNLPGTALRIIKNKVDESLQPGEYYVWTVYFDNGGKQNIKVTADNFDPTAYYANQNKVVVNVDYNWEKHNEI